MNSTIDIDEKGWLAAHLNSLKGSFNIVIFQTLPINALSVQFNKLTLYYSHYFCTH